MLACVAILVLSFTFPADARKRAVNRAIELCFLENVIHQSIDTLSKGYKHRTCLAQSLIHDPPILIMDEPTDGLDPNQKHEVRNLIKRMGEDKAIIFSTHILEEVEAACSRVIIIDRGKIVANGTPAELKARSEMAGAVRLRIRNDGGLFETAFDSRVYPNGSSARGSLTRDVAELAAQQHWQVAEIYTEEGRLDEVFRSITLPDTVRVAA